MTLAAAIASAAPPQPPEFRHAVARRGCTQEDARALEVYLTRARYEGEGEPAPPYARMEIAWDAWARAGGEALEFVPLARRGADRRKPTVRATLSAGGGRGGRGGRGQRGRIAAGPDSVRRNASS